MHYCNTHQHSGLLLFCDAAKAFDRVNHSYLLRTMKVMGIPPAFRDAFTLLLTNATTRIKVNGYLGNPIALLNGVRQGDPCAPLAFLLSIQPLLSMLRLSSRGPVSVPTAAGSPVACKLQGIQIPSIDGVGTTAEISAAMADDVAVALRDADQLPPFKLILDCHERASGGLNNWDKTYGVRLGSLATSTYLPPGWNPRHVDFSQDPEAVRYLGIFLGSPDAVLRRWYRDATDASNRALDDLTSRMEHRLDQWASLGAAVTYAGRNLIVKNSVLAMAWYMVESQTFEGEDAVFTRWQASAWRFVEASVAALA